MIGTTISHYRVIGSVGVGGMGMVYLAEDTRLNRKVALKFLPPAIAQDAHARGRFLLEAQAASALDHPNVATIYEIGDWNDQLFIAMAFYDGETLRARLERGPVAAPEATGILLQLATGLAAAHHAGIVHRDLKPANAMLTRDGQVKILDFGLAKMVSDAEQTATRITGPGTTMGTVAYMAPEQAQGAEVDRRADVWAFGVIAYEMLTGRLPFKADNPAAALVAILTETPAPIRSVRPDVPDDLVRLVDQSLQRPRERRTLTADGIVAALSASQALLAAARVAGPGASAARVNRRPLIAAAIALVAVAATFGWYLWRESKARWARERALPEIQRLADQEQFVAAFKLASEAKRYAPTDPAWNRLDPLIGRAIASVETSPSGATISYREYANAGDEWTALGQSPLARVRIPAGFFAWKAEKPGLTTVEDIGGFSIGLGIPALSYTLSDSQQAPAGMVYVPPTTAPYHMSIPGLDHLPAVDLQGFWIDKYEVTNREFKRFVDAGGYRERGFWREAFIRDGRPLAFEQAMGSFSDATGRPGPATWELGSYPDGQDDFPVTGISWYEAAAYAAFAGKALPTIYHWSRVATQRTAQFVVPHSNFGGRGPTKVGSTGGMNRFGAFDMAGNVKEWCWNRADAMKRYILGGAWDEPVYSFTDPDARSPFERAANFGFRSVKYSPKETLVGTGAELVAFEARDFSKETSVNDHVFDVYRRMYAYDKTPLRSTNDATDDSNPDWRREKISFAAAYGNERVPALLYLPKAAVPPYQAVVFFPGSGSLQQRSSAQIDPRTFGGRGFDAVIRSGRAIILPIYKSTYERGDDVESDYPANTSSFREHAFAWSKDVSRAIDYLETRPDIAHDKIAYMGVSWGAAMAPIYIAVEPRFKAAVLIAGGFYLQHSAPEVDAFNFAPRVRIPTLLLNGRFDFFFPMDASQLPMFRLFGVPEDKKRRVIYDTGHNIPGPELIRETVDWLDKYLGPVR